MRKRYFIVYGFLIAMSVGSLFAYIKIQDGNIINILGNVFAGIITGLILSILSNIKNVGIRKKLSKN